MIDTASVRAWIEAFAGEIAEHREELVRLDTAIGDGDHGTNMNRGMTAVVEKLGDEADIGAVLKSVAMTLISKVGGASGPLYGTLFLQMGTATAGYTTLDVAGLAAALDAGLKGVQARGRAEPGDKTMLDALTPALAALRDAEADGDVGVAEAAARATQAAEEGMKATIPMEARKGRASYLGPRSVGHQDPGATSSYLLLRSAGEAFATDGVTELQASDGGSG
jgi:phosphoenolpyruvate---glycerone phosphotransferase subunit DhaL